MKKLTKVVLGSTVLLASSSAFANEDIIAAVTAGEVAVQLVVAGVIGLAALAFGLGMIKSWLGK